MRDKLDVTDIDVGNTEQRPTTSATETIKQLPQSPYEQMCRALYSYGFGTIGFLDMLSRFEEALRIQPPQIGFHNNSGEEE